MRKVLKWIGLSLAGIVCFVLLAGTTVYVVSNMRFEKTYAVAVAPIRVDADSASLVKGRHVATIRGCVDCHGNNFGGSIFIDDPALGRLSASNLTSGKGGVGAEYTDEDWVRAIRHGVGPDGHPLLFMPSHEYYTLSDEDMSAMIAFFRTLPPVDNELPLNSVGPLGRALFLAGQIPLVPAELIDHEAERPIAPLPGVTVEYGHYMAAGCIGCHGDRYSGGKIPGAPPTFAPARNLTPDKETGLGNWTEEDFFRALREGKRPDGTELHPSMPWHLTAQMTDEEIKAMWLFLQTLPPLPYGNR